MKMNKKGFTLIELLAVIVILAVIALIAVPQILKVLNNARKSAAEDSVYGVAESAETYVADLLLDLEKYNNISISFEFKLEDISNKEEKEEVLGDVDDK